MLWVAFDIGNIKPKMVKKTMYSHIVIDNRKNNKNGKKSLAELKHLKNTFNANTAYG